MVAEMQYHQWSSRYDLLDAWGKYNRYGDYFLDELKEAYIKFETIDNLMGKVLSDREFLKAVEEVPIPCETEAEILKAINKGVDYGAVVAE